MKEENISVTNILTDYLTRRKYRKTPERYAILDKIYSIDGHFDAESLYESMQNEYRVSLATIYNTLDLLSNAGLVIKHQFDGFSAQYEKSFGTHIHNHSVCIVCGAIKEFTDKKIKKAIQAKEFANFQSTHYSLYIYGKCKKCRNK
ncbi:Fur family transcriptional regulator [Paludibacter sp.]